MEDLLLTRSRVQGLREIATYAAAIGPPKSALVTRTQAGREVSGLARAAAQQGLQIHPYTFRDEAQFLAPGGWQSAEEELEWYFGLLGADAGFADYPATLATFLRGYPGLAPKMSESWRAARDIVLGTGG